MRRLNEGSGKWVEVNAKGFYDVEAVGTKLSNGDTVIVSQEDDGTSYILAGLGDTDYGCAIDMEEEVTIDDMKKFVDSNRNLDSASLIKKAKSNFNGYDIRGNVDHSAGHEFVSKKA